MKTIIKIGALGLLCAGLLFPEPTVAQKATNLPAGGNNQRPGGGNGGGGWGGGGWGGGGWNNPYNPFSPYSPYNPISPYSPYNPISPLSPYYSPYYAPYYSSMYLYNPIFNPGLVSRSPWRQAEALTLANIGTQNAYSYMWNYDASLNYYQANLQSQQAQMQNYYAQLYQQEAQNQYVQAANLTTYAAYTALQAQQYQNSMANPYGVVPASGTRPAQAPIPAQSPRYQSGFTGSGGTNQPANYDPFVSTSPGSSYGGERPSGFDGQIRAVQPTYSQVQARIAAEQLHKIQTTSTPGEIIAGLAQNILLKDIAKFPGLEPAMPPLKIPQETLKEINVVKNKGNLGVIRNDGRISWPKALSYVLTPDQQRHIEKLSGEAIANATTNKANNDTLIRLGSQIDNVRGILIKRINEIPTSDYMEAKRYLNDFDDAVLALQGNEWPNYIEYQKFIEKGNGAGRTVQDLAKFLTESGYFFAPATGQDAGSYRAVYNALVAYDVQLNAQFLKTAARD